jgi:hypothetical protein
MALISGISGRVPWRVTLPLIWAKDAVQSPNENALRAKYFDSCSILLFTRDFGVNEHASPRNHTKTAAIAGNVICRKGTASVFKVQIGLGLAVPMRPAVVQTRFVPIIDNERRCDRSRRVGDIGCERRDLAVGEIACERDAKSTESFRTMHQIRLFMDAPIVGRFDRRSNGRQCPCQWSQVVSVCAPLIPCSESLVG